MTPPPAPPADAGRFPSFLAMRAAHTALLDREDDGAAEMRAAILDFVERGQATGALIDAESERRAAQSLLSYWSTQLYRSGLALRPVTLSAFDPDLAPALPDEPRPYRGLEAFGEADQSLFFGRESLVDELLQHLAAHRLAALLGPSGSGKSSVVRAGLLPALKAGRLPGSEHWRYAAPLVPGSDPARALDHALPTAAGDPAQPLVLVVDQFEELFTLNDRPAAAAFAARLLELVRAAGAPAYVILTLRSDYEAQLAALPDLQTALNNAVFRVRPLSAGELRRAIEEPAHKVGLRFEEGVVDDLLGEILGEPAALPLLQFTLLQLWEHRQRNRVTRAAYRALGGGRQALQTAADRFFAERLLPQEREVARRIFLRLVRPSAEGLEVTSQRLRRRELFSQAYNAEITESVLNKLIREARLLRQTEGETPADTQVEVAHEALVRNWPTLVGWLEDERENVRQRNRLRDQARRWLAEAQDANLLWRGRYLEAAEQASDLSPEEAGFVAASRAQIEREAAEKEAARQRELEAAASRRIAEVERQRADEQAQAARELRRRLTLTRLLVGALLLACAGMIVLAVRVSRISEQAVLNAQAAQTAQGRAEAAQADALTQKAAADAASGQALLQKATAEAAAAAAVAAQQTAEVDRQLAVAEAGRRAEAEQAAQLALARQLAAQAQTRLISDPTLALLLSIQAYGITQTVEVTTVLSRAVQQAAARTVTAVDLTLPPLSGERVRSLRFDGDTALLWAGSRGTLTGWDFGAGRPRPVYPGLISPAGTGIEAILVLTPTNFVAVSRDNGELFILDAPTLAITQPLMRLPANPALNPPPTTSLALSPEGAMLAAGATDGSITLWVWAEGRPLTTPIRTRTQGAIQALAFSGAGDYLAAGSKNTAVLVFEARSGNRLVTLTEHQAPVTAVAWIQDAGWLVTASADGAVLIWQLDLAANPPAARRAAAIEPAGGAGVSALAVSPDQRVLVVGQADGALIYYDVRDPAAPARIDEIRQHGGRVEALAFAPEGGLLASGDQAGYVLLQRVAAPDAPAGADLKDQACRLVGAAGRAAWEAFFADQVYAPPYPCP